MNPNREAALFALALTKCEIETLPGQKDVATVTGATAAATSALVNATR